MIYVRFAIKCISSNSLEAKFPYDQTPYHQPIKRHRQKRESLLPQCVSAQGKSRSVMRTQTSELLVLRTPATQSEDLIVFWPLVRPTIGISSRDQDGVKFCIIQGGHASGQLISEFSHSTCLYLHTTNWHAVKNVYTSDVEILEEPNLHFPHA